MEPITAEQALENARDLTFEKVWATITALGQRVDDTTANIDKMGKRMDEAAAIVAETSKEVARMSKKVDKVTENVGGLNRSMGELIESLMTSRLWEKFDRYGHHLVRAYTHVPLYNEKNETLSDIDLLLSNTDECMAVEIKREAKTDDIDHHSRRMQLIEKYPPAEAKGKKIYSAIAGAVVQPDVRDYAYEKGMYVLEMNGEHVSLLEPPEGFKANVW
jgi:hypothetical protein